MSATKRVSINVFLSGCHPYHLIITSSSISIIGIISLIITSPVAEVSPVVGASLAYDCDGGI
jgi:hypothetical protein